MGSNPTLAWFATRQATSTALLILAVRDTASRTRSTQPVMRPCCTTSRPMEVEATLVWSWIPQATSTGRARAACRAEARSGVRHGIHLQRTTQPQTPAFQLAGVMFPIPPYESIGGPIDSETTRAWLEEALCGRPSLPLS